MKKELRSPAPAALAATVAFVALLVGACGEDEAVTTWKRDGEKVDANVMESSQGAEHCDWSGVTVLRVAWPLGTPGTNGHARTYVRDPEHKLSAETLTAFDAKARLPIGAGFTGYSSDDGELWLDPAAQDRVAYLVPSAGPVEAWPRTKTLLGCD